MAQQPAAAAARLVRGHEVRDFRRFMAERWQAPDWRLEEARAALEGKTAAAGASAA